MVSGKELNNIPINMVKVRDLVNLHYIGLENDFNNPQGKPLCFSWGGEVNILITGSLYNQENPSLIQSDIKSNKHKTLLTSKTVGKGEQGRNELTMSNMPGREQVYLKAEKDYEELVQHDYNQTILNNKTSSVTGSHTENILQAHIQNIAGLKDVNVGGEYLTVVALSKDTAVGLSNTLNVGAENTLRVAGDNNEFINGDKIVEVEGDTVINIYSDKKELIGGNVLHEIKGSYNLISDSGIVVFSDNNFNLTSDYDFEIYSNNNTTINSKGHLSLKSNTSDIQFDGQVDIISEDSILIHCSKSFSINVNNDMQAQVSSDGFSFKVNEVELSITSDGVKIKGGNLKIEK